ncbi:MAG TPA: hypothetical protein VGB95_02425 [Chitinophagales bacterium]
MTIQTLIYIWIAIAFILCPIEMFVKAPYGRHSSTSFGIIIPDKLGWFIMESWALIVFLIIYAIYFNANKYALFFGMLYALHYVNRGIIYPLRTRTTGKKMPLMIALSAMFFNSVNASTIDATL